jgi:two-component system chemotaxis response regulator CheB
MPIKVMIIDDSALVRDSLTQILSSDPEIVVSDVAIDPIFAARKISQNRPDVIILDIEMERMDGLTFLKKMNQTVDPIPCIMCSTMITEGSPNEEKALEYGACDIIQKPALGTRKFLEESKIRICDAVKAAYQSRGKLKHIMPLETVPVQPKLSADVILNKPAKTTVPVTGTQKVIVIGASTGGTEALKDVLTALPENVPGIVVVQHMPEHFTAAFAKRLDGLCRIAVKEGADGDKVVPGQAIIAPGNKHMLLKRLGDQYFIEIRDGPLVSRHRPSVDVLFRSAARYAGKNAVGVIMTGMGDDGAQGMKEMHDAGAFTIAQDEATCVVFGMPAEAIKKGGVDKVVPLPNIPSVICQMVQCML